MKRYSVFFIAVLLILSSCAPVFKEEIMKNATLNPSLAELNEQSTMYEGKLYVFGGKIVNTRVTKDGSLIEAIYVPVDSRGNLKDYMQSIRFLALLPQGKGILDPMIFSKNREITIAGIYKGVRTGQLDEIHYPYAYFEIVDFHLWEERVYYPPYPYPYWYDPWYDPWYGPWHRPHWW